MPEQHTPPVYACAAGAVLHVHADSTLEPAVVLHTFVPAAVRDRLDGDVRVDVSSDGPGAPTVTVRVLADGQSVSWSLPLAPFVAALPGQSGDDGRMVLLAVVDNEPSPTFWDKPVDCETLAAELQLPVADLAEALRGRLTPWLAEDLELLLHDDAHDRAADTSAPQTVADAVLAQYRGDLDGGQALDRLVQALAYAPEPAQMEIGVRLCAALGSAVRVAGPTAVSAVLEALGPFEAEEARLLHEVPAALAAGTAQSEAEAAMGVVVAAPDRDESVRAAARVVALLAREAFGADLPGEQVLARLEMVDDAAMLRLARLWVDLALAAGDQPVALAALAERVQAEGAPGRLWLVDTAQTLAQAAQRVAGRRVERLVPALRAAQAGPTLDELPRLTACVELAAYVRQRHGIGPGAWLLLPAPVAASATLVALLDGADRDAVVDLLTTLLEGDVGPVDLLDGLVCATASLLVGLDPQQDLDVRRLQVAELLDAVPAGPRGARWLLVALLRLAPQHDPLAQDLSEVLPDERAVDADRAAERLGLHGLMRAGLDCLAALSAVLGEEADLPLDELYREVLPGALVEHELLRAGT